MFPVQVFGESSQFLQGAFQRLWVLLLFARAKGQVTKGECDRIVFQFPTRRTRKGDRLKLTTRLNMRSTAEFFEKTYQYGATLVESLDSETTHSNAGASSA